MSLATRPVKIAVTGASGFIGGVICRALRAAGDDAVPIVRRACDLEGARIVSAFEREPLRAALADCNAVVHAASVMHRRGAPLSEYVALNVRGTEALLHAAEDAGVKRFVFLSSVKIYGEGPFERVTEDTPPASDPGYAGTKLDAERLIADRDSRFANGTCSLRLVPVFGVGDKGNVRSMIINAARRTLAIPGDGQTQKSLVHVTKVAAAAHRAAHTSHRGVYIVADPSPPTVRQLADAITGALGRRRAPSLPILPLTLAARAVDRGLALLGRDPRDVAGMIHKSQFRTVFDPSKYQRTFEHSLHLDLDHTIREEVAWLRESGTIR